MSDKAIIVENLSKRYRIGLKEEAHDTLGGAVASWVKSPVSNFMKLRNLSRFNGNGHAEDVIWAVKDVSFEVKPGEVVGIIGRNGAGKSTLLKMLSRITDPTSGRVIINGRVSSLLEVGTGFHQELTGRENVYLNGAILGMSRREIDRKFDEIIAFAEIGKFIDTPVKHYSSGMKVRLAFAVAAHLEPEILLVDEVLAVGDISFQKKCLGKMGDVAKGGRTVLFVSHQLDMTRTLCDRCVLMHQGGISDDGSPESVIETYLNSVDMRKQSMGFQLEEDSNLDIQVIGGCVTDASNQLQDRFDIFTQIKIELEYKVRSPIRGAAVYLILERNGTTLFQSFDTDTDASRWETRQPGTYRSCISLPCPLLKSGHYSITCGTVIPNVAVLQRIEGALEFEVEFQSIPSASLSYAEKRSGVIAVPVNWLTTNTSL